MSDVERVLAGLGVMPFPPGGGPFKIKGVPYRGHLEFVAERIPGGIPAMLAALPDPAQRAFFDQTFLAASFYDVFPLVVSSAVSARLARISLAEFVEQRSRVQAKADATGIYKFLLNLVTGEQIARWLPRFMSQYFSFGETTTALVGPGHVDTVVRGIPEPIALWYSMVAQSYVEAVFALAGVSGGNCSSRPPTREGARDGVPTSRIEFEVRWTPA